MTLFSQDLSGWPREYLDHARRALAEAEIGPSPDTLADSPHLDLWQPIRMSTDLCLAGAVSGHPLLQSSFITTSPLIALRPEEGWARTISRFYQLGQRLDTALGRENGGGVAIVGAFGYPAVTVDTAQVRLANVASLIRQRTDN